MAKQVNINKNEPEDKKIFGVWNYRLMIIGVLMLLVGFIFMIGGGSDDPNVFNYEMFSFRHITLSTLFILGGFTVEVFAIMMKFKK